MSRAGDAADATARLVEIAAGVFVWRTPGSGPGTANAGVVLDDDGITIVDTLMVRSQWIPFAVAVAALDRPVRRVVLTHAHIEQVGGTMAFRGAAVLGSPATSDALDRPMPLSAYQAFMPDQADELAELVELGTRPVSHEVADPVTLTPRVELLPAFGHTAGDLVVLVADADVCFAGGLASFGVAPLGFQADLRTWVGTLDALAELADAIVPANGPTGDPDAVGELRRYLSACIDAHGDPRALPAGPWDAWSNRYPADAINVERAELLAHGRDELPPTMVELTGLGRAPQA